MEEAMSKEMKNIDIKCPVCKCDFIVILKIDNLLKKEVKELKHREEVIAKILKENDK
jgi:hypothetical protein